MIERIAARYELACRAVLVILIVNAAMLVHTLRGAIVLGAFPSVGAAFSTYRTWLLDEDRSWSMARTWRTFAEGWRQEFPRANAPGYAFLGIWLVLLLDHRILHRAQVDTVGLIVSGILITVIVLFAVFTALFWIVRATFDEPARWLIRITGQMVIARPVSTLMLLALGVILLWAITTYPAAVFALGPSALIFAASIIVFSFGRMPGMSVVGPENAHP